METLLSRDIKGTFDVQLSGGCPWGFTLQGGSEFNTKLCIAKITPGGKADQTKVLSVGDEVVAINGMTCTARAEAIEQIRCSRQNLRLTIKRGSSAARQNGMPQNFQMHHTYATPNLYQTALEVATGPADFFTTYSVDPAKYARVAGHSKMNKPALSRRTDSDLNLSASNEDLLERYRESDTQPKGSNNIEVTENTGGSSDMANGRMSPEESIQVLSCQSLPESQLHGRTFTSPGRIQKVKVTCANISSSSSLGGTPGSDRLSPEGRISPNKHSPVARQPHVTEIMDVEDTQRGNDQNWFEKWLREDQRHVPSEQNVSVIAARSKFETVDENPEEKPSVRTSNFSRSKSFSGRPSYGVMVATTAVKGEGKSTPAEINAFQAPLPPSRYSSSDLLREKPARRSLPANEFWKSSTASLSSEIDPESPRVTLFQEPGERNLDVRIPSVYSSSTSSLDSLFTHDSSGARRVGPAPPPRRSESKLLSSFRVRGRRMPAQVIAASRTPSATEPHQHLMEPPRHVASRSWPSDHLGDNSRTFSDEKGRQSWHAQPSQLSRNTTTNPDTRPHDSHTGSRRSTSVSIKAIKTSHSSSSSLEGDPKTPMYRSSSVEFTPEIQQVKRPHTARSRMQTPPSQNLPGYENTIEPGSSRIEDTHILQRLMKDNELNTRPTVKSRIQTFEKASPQPTIDEGPDVQQLRPRSHQLHTTWDKTQASPTQRNPDSDNRYRGTRTSPPGKMEHNVNEDSIVPVEKEHKLEREELLATSTVREKSESPRRVMHGGKLQPDREKFATVIVTTSPVSKQNRDIPTVSESITRTESTSVQEKEVFFQELFKKMSEDKSTNGSDMNNDKNTGNSLGSVKDVVPPPPSSVGEDEVFLSHNDSLPPPPSFEPHETSHDNLPLPSPPKEVLVHDSPQRQAIEVKAVEHEIKTTESPRKRDSLHMGENKRNSYPREEHFHKPKNSSSRDELNVRQSPSTNEQLNRENRQSPRNRDYLYSEKKKRNSYPNERILRNWEEQHHLKRENIHSKSTRTRDSLEKEEHKRYSYPNERMSRGRNESSIQPSFDREKHFSREKPIQTEIYSCSQRSESPHEKAPPSRMDYSPNYERLHEEHAITEDSEKHVSLHDESSTSMSSSDNQNDLPETSMIIAVDSPEDRAPGHDSRLSKTPPPAPLVITSTSTRDEECIGLHINQGLSSPFSEGSNLSTPSSSRPNSMMSPKLEALDKEKSELVNSMKRKISDLQDQMNEISDEIEENEKLGEKVTMLVEGKTTTSEFSKYMRFTGELNKIILLLLSLTQRMHRYEKTLGELDMSEESDRQQRDILQDKIEHVKNQYEEACKIKEVNDKRGEVVSKFLEIYLDEENFADFEYYIDMKTQLALMHAEIRDKVKMGEERLSALSTTEIDWSIMSLF